MNIFTSRSSRLILTLSFLVLLSVQSTAQVPIFSPGMTITCLNSCTSPGGEEVDRVIDQTNFKFLDLNRANTGFIVNTGFSSLANRIEFTTANDFPIRDPADYTLAGSNDGVSWTNIASGTIPCIATRLFARGFSFSNVTFYTWYRVSFADVCGGGGADAMQIAEVQLYVDNTLPIRLISFTSQVNNNNNILLKWNIAQPEEDGVYELQRSTDGRNFISLNTQIGNASRTQFSYIDNYFLAGTTYYRLKMMDKAGQVTYSNIAFIKGGNSKDFSLSVYPSPAVKGSDVQISISNAILEGWQLINTSGITIAQKTNIKITGSTTLQLPETITTGVYYLRIQTDKGVKNQKIIIQ